MEKKKTSLGTWLFVAVVILISFASAWYNQYQRDEVKREVIEKYQIK